MPVLYEAWRTVRASAITSSSPDVKNEALIFESESIKRLRSIQRRLQTKKFQFQPQLGIAKKRDGKSPRPLVLAPIENRIVQRAILDVLQDHVYFISEVLEIPNSFGGLKRKNTKQAIEEIMEQHSIGKSHFIRSDIPNFFTKVSRERILEILKPHIQDNDFINLFSMSIETILKNYSQLSKDGLAGIFPNEYDGIAQGSPLSPLIANIYLHEFDNEFNKSSISCVRYIDDFVILAESESEASKGFRMAKAILKREGLDCYSPELNPEKAERGHIDHKGLTFLGCHITGRLIKPTNKNRDRLLEKIDTEIFFALKQANKSTELNSVEKGFYAKTLVNINNLLVGWGRSFSFCNSIQTLESLDQEISKKIDSMEEKINKLLIQSDYKKKRRILGITLLTETRLVEKNGDGIAVRK